LYAFCNHVEVHADGRQFNREIMPYDREAYQSQQIMHAVTALVPTAWAREVGGFDPSLIGWEEYDFFMKLALLGHCGVLVRQPLLYYRVDTGERRKISYKNADKLNAEFQRRFGGKPMAGCCGNGGNSILEAKRALGLLPRETLTVAELPNEVRLMFIGVWMGPVGFQVNGRTYYGAADELHKFVNAPREDVDKLVATGKWVIVQPPEGSRITEVIPEPVRVSPSPCTERLKMITDLWLWVILAGLANYKASHMISQDGDDGPFDLFKSCATGSDQRPGLGGVSIAFPAPAFGVVWWLRC